MEDGLREFEVGKTYTKDTKSLNPCFNGRWSARREKIISYKFKATGLNPCFNGRWSARGLSISP